MLKCWADFPGYDQFVRDKWGSLDVQGWGGFVLHKKLKIDKNELERMAPTTHSEHGRKDKGNKREDGDLRH